MHCRRVQISWLLVTWGRTNQINFSCQHFSARWHLYETTKCNWPNVVGFRHCIGLKTNRVTFKVNPWRGSFVLIDFLSKAVPKQCQSSAKDDSASARPALGYFFNLSIQSQTQLWFLPLLFWFNARQRSFWDANYVFFSIVINSQIFFYNLFKSNQPFVFKAWAIGTVARLAKSSIYHSSWDHPVMHHIFTRQSFFLLWLKDMSQVYLEVMLAKHLHKKAV